MRFRIYMALAIAFLAALLMGPLQQWPASTILFSDGKIYQDRYDDRCADAGMQGSATTNQTTSTIANGQFVPIVYPNANQSLISDPRSCWTEATTGNIEYIYSCPDGLTRVFNFIFLTSVITLSGPSTFRTFFGVNAGGSVVDGDEDETVIFEETIPNFNFKAVGISSRLTLNDGDHIALGYKQLSGAPDNLAVLGWDLLVTQGECYSDTEI